MKSNFVVLCQTKIFNDYRVRNRTINYRISNFLSKLDSVWFGLVFVIVMLFLTFEHEPNTYSSVGFIELFELFDPPLMMTISLFNYTLNSRGVTHFFQRMSYLKIFKYLVIDHYLFRHVIYIIILRNNIFL